MPKRENSPTLWWARVQWAISTGSMNITQIPGTSMIRVNWGRIHLTWFEGGKKRTTRVRFRRCYLNPRWINLPKEYPIKTEDLNKMTDAELAVKGIIRLRGNVYKLLIYQQLGSLYALLRQLKYISAKYKSEEEELWEKFAETLYKISLEPQNDLPKDILERLEQIGAIKSHLAGREEAIKTKIRRTSYTQRYVRGALESLAELVPKTRDDENVEGTIIGLRNSLERHHGLLVKLRNDAPFYSRARWARYHIDQARRDLKLYHFERALYHINKAIGHLSVKDKK